MDEEGGRVGSFSLVGSLSLGEACGCMGEGCGWVWEGGNVGLEWDFEED